jgi:glycosyltransferase involved in cell wall biosynthesis
MDTDQPMRIAVFHDLPAGGGKRALYEHCRELCRLGHHLDLFIPETANETFLPLDPFIRSKRVFPLTGARRVPGRPSGWTRLAWWSAPACHRKIARVINAGGYDAVFMQQSIFPHIPYVLRYLTVPSLFYLAEPTRIFFEAPVEELNRYKRYAPQSFKFKEWFWGSRFVHRFWTPLVNRRHAERINLRYTNRIMTNSYFSCESILRAYGVPAVAIYSAVDSDRFRPLDLPRKPMALSVGMAQPLKGFRFLVESIGCIPPEIRPELFIAAHGERRGERALLHNLAEEKGVQLTIEAVDDDELIRLYNTAMVVVFVPYLEPFGFIPLEAMACGAPVVGIREGGVRESIIDGETGFLIDRDTRACAEAITRLLTDAGLRERMGAAGRAAVETAWTWARSGKQVADLLTRIVQEEKDNRAVS